MDIIDTVLKFQEMYDGTPTSELRKERAKGGVIKDPTFTKFSKGGKANGKKPLKTKKKDIKVASETSEEEAEMMLNMELKEFKEWLKKNKGKNFKDYMKDKTAFLTDEQKKDPKIIEIYDKLPSFQEELQKIEELRKLQEEDEASIPLEKFLVKRAEEIRRKENARTGLGSILL
tara:strand:+ start:1897 stop:2418 length:522 start_codon:yes stop_codon:yes gene_type:complete